MSLLGRACASGAHRFCSSSMKVKRKEIVSLSYVYLKPASCVSRHFLTVQNQVRGGKLQKISKAATDQARRAASLQGGEGEKNASWSGWEIAAASLLAIMASATMIVKPRAQNEPSVDTSPQHQRVAIVQRAPNRVSPFKNIKENQYMEEDEDEPFTTTESIPSKQNEAVFPNGKGYDVSVRAVKGNRVTMEDEYFVAPGGRFVAVFDGHGGGGVSAWLRTKLYGLMCRYLKETHWEEQVDETENRTPSVSAHVGALRKAFEQVEKDVVAQEILSYQGSTAVAVLLHESDDGHRTLISANVGDSRAILSRQGRAIDLTRDHKPNEEREKARILNMGEAIEWDSLSKVHRVRNLSLSRAIGDRYAKPVVSSQVEIKLFPVAEDGDEFFILASDGLWDVMSSQEVVTYVHQRFQTELSREQLQSREDKENYKLVLRRNMARALTREALRRGSGDNICVLMVWLKDLPGGKK